VERGAHRRTEPDFVMEGLAHSSAAKAAHTSHSGDGWMDAWMDGWMLQERVQATSEA
jgi:hypothetical protein